MSELQELYQELVLDHNRRPRNVQKLAGANRTAEGYHPLCGDRITVYVRLEDGVVRDFSFQGSGCAIATAAASMMGESVKGKTTAEAAALFKAFHTMVTADLGTVFEPIDLGKLAAFSGVREFPIRVKCATLPWHTLRAALEEKAETCSTE